MSMDGEYQHPNCLVCYSEFDVAIPKEAPSRQRRQQNRFFHEITLYIRAKTPCDHNDICGVCHLRLRHLHNDNKCPICKQSNERIIVDSTPPGNRVRRFSDYHMWGDDELGPDFQFQVDVGMFFPIKYYESDIRPLFGLHCTQPDCEFDAAVPDNMAARKHGKKPPTPLRSLQDHLRMEHKLALCQLCVDHKRDFVARLPRWTPRQLQNHLKTGDGADSGFTGHPLCEFCKPKRFYDLGQLHNHLNREHYLCHVCDKSGKPNQFFRDYKSLERHFDNQHFLCHDAQCLAARFIVFQNELDLRGHELSVHGGTSTGSTKINLEFRTRRAGYDGGGIDNQQVPTDRDFAHTPDGQAFVPEALPMTGGNQTSGNSNRGEGDESTELHPQHLQRTAELRQQAALIRERQNSNGAESFPTLAAAAAPPAAANANAPLRTGWAGGATMQRLQARNRPAGRVTEEDFPTLGGGSGKAKLSSLVKPKKAAPRTIASGPRFSATAAAPRTAPSQAQANNFLTPLTRPGQPSQPQANLQASNFPSLGASSSANTYAAANAFASARNRGGGATSSNMASVASRPAPARGSNVARVAPQVNLSAADFPAPPSASASNSRSVRDRMLGDRPASAAAMSNVLNVPAVSMNAEATLEEMKASLGPKKFQKLKSLTKNFAENKESAEGYVDASAMLFDKGYTDPDFWVYLPTLLQSCPNRDAAEYAITYMQSLRRQQYGAETGGKKKTAPAASVNSNWNNGLKLRARDGGPQTVPSKKKGAVWGGNAPPASVVRSNKASPGVSATASLPSQGGTATKFMAHQQKKNKAHANKKKAKQKDELRSLAFN